MFLATHASIRTSTRSSKLHNPPSPPVERSPTSCRFRSNSRASVGDLSPVPFSAPPRSTSELLRTLSRMAASGPTSWLSRHDDLVSHLATSSGPQLRVRALSLSTMKLISHGPTAMHPVTVFGVCPGSVSVAPPRPYSALPPLPSTQRQPQSCFGENKLSPGSFGISPLHTDPPRLLQQSWVRPSIACYRTFSLSMRSSPGFVSNPCHSNARFRLAFASPPGVTPLGSPQKLTRWLILQKARHHSTACAAPL